MKRGYLVLFMHSDSCENRSRYRDCHQDHPGCSAVSASVGLSQDQHETNAEQHDCASDHCKEPGAAFLPCFIHLYERIVLYFM